MKKAVKDQNHNLKKIKVILNINQKKKVEKRAVIDRIVLRNLIIYRNLVKNCTENNLNIMMKNQN